MFGASIQCAWSLPFPSNLHGKKPVCTKAFLSLTSSPLDATSENKGGIFTLVWLHLAGTRDISSQLAYYYQEMKSWECYPP